MFRRIALLLAAACFLCTLSRGAAAPETGPRLTDEAFYTMLDLARPGLAEVKAAVEKRDWAGARHALAQYYRTRKEPHWTFDPAAIGHEKGRRHADAEDAMRHKLRSLGISWQFGEHIDWAFNPTTQPGSKWARNHEWTWQLNRHPMWTDLMEAWRATGDEKYPAEFAKQLASWVHDCPVPVKEADNKAFSRWRTIEAGIRTGAVWPDVFFGFLSAKSFDDETLTLMVKSFVEHAQYLTHFQTHGNNWLTMESNGLYHVGALFPEFKEAKTWRDTGLGRLAGELDGQVYPDGAQVELAPGYHGVTVRNFLGPVELVPLTGCAVPPEYLGKMEKMFNYYLYSMQPTRVTPPFNDSGAGDAMSYLRLGARLFPARKDFLWAATDGKEGAPPERVSCEFPYAGWFIMRGGWGRNDSWLCMEGGPYGMSHQHEDKLNVILTAFGRPLLVEGGTYTYDASEWRKYVLSSRAHNVVLVDGLEQNRRRSPRETYVVKTPLPHVWESNAERDHAGASYEEGWGPKAEALVKHTRHVWFLKARGCFVIADMLEPKDGKEHTYEALFHLEAENAAVEGLRVSTQNKGPNLTVIGVGADSVRIVKGQEKPEVQGWIPDHDRGYGGVRPIPTAIYSKRGGRVIMYTVLCPTPQGGKCTLAEAAQTQDGLRLKWADGTEEKIF